ncbi:MAG: hypothetical protein H6625_13745 [Bdellovibrionaceae bacterium]|nr:hypothetical protein [Pseudobdellovibrionaceae bacterium]
MKGFFWLLTLTSLSSFLFLSACGKSTGNRTPIRNASAKSGNGGSEKVGSTIKPTFKTNISTKKKCIDLDDLINKKLMELKQADLRVYTSDLRVLEDKTLISSNQNTMSQPAWAQTNLVIEKINGDPSLQLPFIEVDYAKNIITKVPSTLAPFNIIEKSQKDCLKLEAKFFDGDSIQREYEIVADESSEIQLVLKSQDKRELYIFRLIGDDQMQFVSFRVEKEREECEKPDTETEILTRTIITYEWNYKEDKQVEISTVLADTLQKILTDGKSKVNTDYLLIFHVLEDLK